MRFSSASASAYLRIWMAIHIIYIAFRSSMLDIAPDYAGIVFGISNTVRRCLLLKIICFYIRLHFLGEKHTWTLPIVRFPTFLASLRPPWLAFCWTTMGTGVSGRLVCSWFFAQLYRPGTSSRSCSHNNFMFFSCHIAHSMVRLCWHIYTPICFI